MHGHREGQSYCQADQLLSNEFSKGSSRGRGKAGFVFDYFIDFLMGADVQSNHMRRPYWKVVEGGNDDGEVRQWRSGGVA